MTAHNSPPLELRKKEAALVPSKRFPISQRCTLRHSSFSLSLFPSFCAPVATSELRRKSGSASRIRVTNKSRANIPNDARNTDRTSLHLFYRSHGIFASFSFIVFAGWIARKLWVREAYSKATDDALNQNATLLLAQRNRSKVFGMRAKQGEVSVVETRRKGGVFT